MGFLTSAVVPIWHTMTPESIESIDSQGFDQVIAVFDGVAMQSIPDRWEVVRLGQNYGQQRARNTGLLYASGRYVLHVDDDTTLYPECLATMVEAIERTGADFVYASYDKTGEFTHPHVAPEWDCERLLRANFVDTTSLVRRHLMGSWNESIDRYQDWDIWLPLAGRGCVGHAIKEPLFSKHYVPGDTSCRGPQHRDEWSARVRGMHSRSARAFTSDWTGPFRANAHRHLWPLRGKPIRYVEVGVYEGRSGCWMLDNILTHPDSRYIGIDTWAPCPDREPIARRNLDHPRRGRRIIKATSDVAASMIGGGIDVLYIDGGHTADDVRRDIEALFPLVASGGIVAFDDYSHPRYPEIKTVVAEFLDATSCTVIESNHQLWCRKA